MSARLAYVRVTSFLKKKTEISHIIKLLRTRYMCFILKGHEGDIHHHGHNAFRI